MKYGASVVDSASDHEDEDESQEDDDSRLVIVQFCLYQKHMS